MQIYHNLSTNKINLVAPIGGFGNHVRNLLILDDRFAFKVTPSEDRYNVFAGPDWPTYDEYCTLGLNAPMPKLIRNEIQEICKEFKNLSVSSVVTLEQKIDFIMEHIYPTERSWHNWMIHEWPFRHGGKDIIEFFHDYPDTTDLTTVCLTCDPQLAFYSYLKFNSNLNNITKENFLNIIKEHNQKCNNITSSNIIVMSSNSLAAPTLDPIFYNTLIERLGFNNYYNLANQLHQRWYELQKNAERDFVLFVNNLYGPP